MNSNSEQDLTEKRLRKPYRPPKQWASESKHASVETSFRSDKKKKMHNTVSKNSLYSTVVKPGKRPVMTLKAEPTKTKVVNIEGTKSN